MQTKIKTTKLCLGAFLSLTILLAGCGKNDRPGFEEDLEIGNIIPTAEQFKALHDKALGSMSQKFGITVDGTGTGTTSFVSEKGTEVKVDLSGPKVNGTGVTSGDMDIEFIELYSKADLLLSGIGTMGKHANGRLGVLKTGGAFYVNISQNGQPIDKCTSCTVRLKVPASLTGGVDNDMVAWADRFDDQGNFVWEPARHSEIIVGQDFYDFFEGSIGWLNIGRFWPNTNPTTSLSVQLSDGFNTTNAKVCVSFDGMPGLAMLYDYDPKAKTFVELSGGGINIGAKCTVIFVTEHEGKWVYAVRPVTITEDTVVGIFGMNSASQSELATLINALP